MHAIPHKRRPLDEAWRYAVAFCRRRRIRSASLPQEVDMGFAVIKGFAAKAPLDNAGQQMNKVTEWIAEDAGPMLPIKQKDATDFLKEVQADIAAKKCAKPLLKLGLDSGHLVMRVEGDNKYAKSVIVVKGYEDEKAQRAKATVVNAQKGDATIDASSKDMAKVKGTTAQTAAAADLNAKGSKAPIIILAHGTPTGSLPGSVYAKDFAKKKPDEIVKYLVGDKKLDKAYAGVVYLDGCYTAAGPKQGRDASELNNFAKKVYDGLVDAGYKYLQVKGNLGAAATLKDGSESVIDAQVEAELEQRKAKLKAEHKALSDKAGDITQRVAQLEKVATALVAKHNGNAETLKTDVGIKLVREEVDKLEVLRSAAAKKVADLKKEFDDLEKDMEVGGKYDIIGLVGVFGPEKLASKPWYRKLFG
jgi:hypothetical protein